MNLCFKCKVELKFIYKGATATSKITHLYTWLSQMQPHSSGQWCYLGFGKGSTKGIPGRRKNHTSCPLRKYFIGFWCLLISLASLVQPKQKGWMTHFLPAPAVGHLNHSSLPTDTSPLRSEQPWFVQLHADVPWEQFPETHTQTAVSIAAGIPAPSLWAVQEPENTTLELLP